MIVFAGCGSKGGQSRLKERWDGHNDPLRMLPTNYQRVLQQLPLAAKIDQTPWSDTYWPDNQGGIAYRWHGDQQNGHEYRPFSLYDVSQLSQKEISKLSPAEKFAVFTNDPSYALWQNEVRRTNPAASSWNGICHGWATASLLFQEPKAITVHGSNGIEVPFGSSDIKALLTLYAADYAPRQGARSLAQRCDIDLNAHPEARNNPECRDVNAGAFHLVLTNEIGFFHRGFIADIDRGIQVWNQPIFGFSSVVTGTMQGASPGAAPGTVQEVSVTTTTTYGAETNPFWVSHGTTARSKDFKYRLELDAYGQIIGGEWLADERPDFLWATGITGFYDTVNNRSGGYVVRFSALQWLYETSVSQSADAIDPLQFR